jgi:putative peptidoglycan lipid II flippase
MAIATLLSRVLGMVRVILYARFMGTGAVAGAFALAFAVPNLFRRLLGEGALTAAFVPLFKSTEKKEGEAAMWRVANVVICGLLIVSAGIVLIVWGGISIALTFGGFDGRLRLVLELVQVMFPYMLLVCVAAIFMGILNSRGHFFLPALGATLLNLVMIPTVLFVAPRWGVVLEDQIFALAYGVLAAGVIQATFMIPALRREGFRFIWIKPFGDPVVKEIWGRMLPGLLGVAAFQINVLLTGIIAGMVDFEINAAFEFAVRLFELPQGLFGVSLATVMLPMLSGLAAENKTTEFKATLNQGLGYIVFVNALMGVLLIVLAEPMVRLLFEGGKFTEESTVAVASVLVWLGAALVPYSMNSILTRAFFALGEYRIPMRITAFCLALNLVLVMSLIWPGKPAAPAMANFATTALNTVLLLFALRRKLGRLGLLSLTAMVIQVICAVAMAGAVCLFLYGWWDHRFGHATLWLQIGEVFVPAGLATLAYILFAGSLKMGVMKELVAMLRKRKAVAQTDKSD